MADKQENFYPRRLVTYSGFLSISLQDRVIRHRVSQRIFELSHPTSLRHRETRRFRGLGDRT